MPAKAAGWLRDKVYEPKRRRTVDLVRRAVDDLRQSRDKVSLASVARRSRALDPEGRGVSESAILGNEEAKAYFDQHRTARPSARRQTTRAASPGGDPTRISLDRDPQTARQRYMRMSKPDLVQRLLSVEQAFSRERMQALQPLGEALTDPDAVRKDTLARRLQQAEQRASRLEQLYAQTQEEVRTLREDNDRLSLQVRLLESGRALL